MPDTTTLDAAPRRELHVFYVLDTSGSMQGQPIQRLNRAMEETTQALKQLARHNGDAKVKIAVMEFNSTVRWMQPAGPEDMEDFFWQDLSAAGMTYVGAALDELNSKLSRHAFLSSMTGAFLPVIIFMTDGYANDDYQAALGRAMQNRWFRKATRVGFAIGDAPDTEMIAKLVGDSEAVIRTNDLGVFAKLLRFVTVSASTIASVSHTTDEAAGGAAAVRYALDDADISYAEVSSGVNYTPEQAAVDFGVDTSQDDFDEFGGFGDDGWMMDDEW